MTAESPLRRYFLLLLFLGLVLVSSGCGKKPVAKVLTATAYCGCSSCCSWERGRARYLHLDFWNRYVSDGPGKGRDYTGHTASGTSPREPQEGLFSVDSIKRPYMIPVRTVLFPWYFFSEDGTIAADTRYYPFGTRMFVPGYGWGMVEDRGGAIKGPDRIDLYFDSHRDALRWGRKKVKVEIYTP
ncbi:3D domain-containing protein [Desulfopila inferna]|uniref:3D domain-containing protein n=1 Tax=Desulfopila inferna TaxID=468528 RepID=UPI001963C03C|nr:3D domain-containing protein [Desulfopila inferna]MBM9604605.1 3D domain-containing protein [Desulfopila inferna]